jgi:hypothetical protein
MGTDLNESVAGGMGDGRWRGEEGDILEREFDI